MNKKYKIVISDCHLSAGTSFESRRNPHEDFHFDDEMVEFFRFFSTGKYGDGIDVELIINGDFFDFLSVPYQGNFDEVITEQYAVYKLECILQGHIRVVEALKTFASKEGKKITYNIGNHDADLFFYKVREHLVQALDPEGKFPSQKVEIRAQEPGMYIEGGVYIEHGNNFEAVHQIDHETAIQTEGVSEPVLNIPWGSVYVLKILNRFKWEREYVDKVRPVKAMIFWGLFTDTWFTLRFVAISTFYFLKTRFVYNPTKRNRFKETAQILKQEMKTFLQDLQDAAREILEDKPDVQTVIFGHTHLPMHKTFQDGRSYINTGTWTKMINMDFRGFSAGGHYNLTFALIEIEDGVANASLHKWVGDHRPHTEYNE